jgi:hypothetical protein
MAVRPPFAAAEMVLYVAVTMQPASESSETCSSSKQQQQQRWSAAAAAAAAAANDHSDNAASQRVVRELQQEDCMLWCAFIVWHKAAFHADLCC